MEIRQLTELDKSDLLIAINGAFADYIVPFQLGTSQLEAKIRNENILMDWSVGVFDGARLVAFILNGMRQIEGKTVIYNAGTGVLPAYRGKGVVGKMYGFIQPFFKERHVKQLFLEVIDNNLSAIRAYEKNGFVKGRKLLCFGGELQVSARPFSCSIKLMHNFPWDILQAFWDIEPSWQNTRMSMELVQPTGLGAFIGSDLVGYILFSSHNNRIYHIAVAVQHRRKGIATQLLTELKKYLSSTQIQLNNVDEKAENLKFFLKKCGLTNRINQFEMIKNI
ncbi:MAG: GNAT family N-acetyltransferase [Sphingobacterium sp.]|jgi:ribosomal protein S18 acetylase RimI-like enzyme|uniref:GNAT family N-acetyltransferase n=1 Tax=Sphingobacterium sp. TaxID=341027 RepID=UPI00283BCE56|nr:GNAT family N-acetyltransferase [Sphingobacterium sp.]MDR3008926.1 GNAT family N-acetyltransferase [Sphingobacterium sp.]